MRVLKTIIALILLLIAFQFTPYNLVNLYFSNAEYKAELNKFNNWKNKTVENKKINIEEYNNIIKQIEEDEKNKKAFDFKKDIERYNSSKEFTYTQIKEFKKDIKTFETLNNFVNAIRLNILLLGFIIFIFLLILKAKRN